MRKNGDAALAHASINGHTSVVELLLEAGVNKDAKNKVIHSISLYALINGVHVTNLFQSTGGRIKNAANVFTRYFI